jgi:small subunit ribosomal protein S19e
MATQYDVNVNDLIVKSAQKLKDSENVRPTDWAAYVKTGAHKERPPADRDWWYVRSAAVLRSVSKLGPVGVSKLRTKYGGKKDRGHKPERFARGSGSILRKILQQLEKEGLVKQEKIGTHSGRIITPKGTKLLDNAASEIYKKHLVEK